MADLFLPRQNKTFLIGRVTRDPELRYTPGGKAVVSFRLATNRSWRNPEGEWVEEVTYVPVVAWGELAERCNERLRKGSPLSLEGRLRSRNWEDQEGKKRFALEVIASQVQFLGKPKLEEVAEEVPEDESIEAGIKQEGESEVEEILF